MPANTPPGLFACSYDTATLGSTASLSSTSIAASPRVLDVSIEGGSARYRLDSTAATQTTGVFLQSSSRVRIYEVAEPDKFTIREISGSPVVHIQGFKYPGV